jgi:glutamyl-Q tRNA(Asp) synthetase
VVVVDDADAGMTRIVRGRDIAPSTATQIQIQRLLGVPTPVYRHHLLLLESRTGPGVDKLAKLHGAIPMSRIQPRHRADQVCGLLAYACGLRADPAPCAPRELLSGFSWDDVSSIDRIARWDDAAGLVIDPP